MVLRTFALGLMLALVSVAPCRAATNSWCFHFFAIDTVDCKDARLTALHDQIDQTYDKALAQLKGKKRAALNRLQDSWVVNRASQCGMSAIELVTEARVRQVRRCLIENYEAHLAKISESLNAPDHDPEPPNAANTADAGQALPSHAVSATAGGGYSPDLAGGRKFWEEQIFQCQVGADTYPSKQDDAYDPKRRYDPNVPKNVWLADYVSDKNCDDGDMTFFSALLCASGDDRGCTGVALGQDTATGRWWRSKGRIGTEPSDGTASFSTEAGLGVLLYMVKTGKQEKFDPWLNYLANAPRGGPFPRYCPHSECVFKIIDCPLFVTVASRFNKTSEALSLCNPLQFLNLPKSLEIKEDLKKVLKQLIDVAARFEALRARISDDAAKALGLPALSNLLPAPAQTLQSNAQPLLDAIDASLERLASPAIAEAAARFAQEIALVNAVVDSLDPKGFKVSLDGKFVYEGNGWRIEDGVITVTGHLDYNDNGEHIVAVELFLLRLLGYSGRQLAQASNFAYQRDGYNPFFDYLANDRPRMLQMLVGPSGKCPTFDKPSTKRYQWFPERGEGPQPHGGPAWVESMYWDCIFLANLYERPVTAALSRPPGDDPFAYLLRALAEFHHFMDDLNAKIGDVQGWVTKMEDALRPDVKYCQTHPTNDLCKLVPPSVTSFCQQNPTNDICAFKDGPKSYCDQNPNNEVCKWTSGGAPGNFPGLPSPSIIPGLGGGGVLGLPL